MNICDSLEGIRPIGKVTCGTYHGEQVLSKKSRLKKSGFFTLSEEFWLPIDRAASKNLLIKSFCYHLEDDEKIIEEDNVSDLISAFIDSFSEDTKYSTNYDGSFECISSSFRDIAIIMENNIGVTGFVCVEDSQQP
tara:strand:- start:295 stop:702 length:408 start_codon:yes stop_codon:yes gene_type:complete